MSAVGLLRNPVLQFLATSVLVLGAVVLATATLSRRAATDEAVSDARLLTTVLGTSVAEPAIPPGLVEQRPGAVGRIDQEVLGRLLVGDVRRLKIWDADGTILYSDRSELVGQRYALDEDEVRILREGGTEAEVSDLDRPENRFERDIGGGLLEVYTRIEAPGGEALLFEAYYPVTELDRQAEVVRARFRPITLGGLLVLVAVTTPLLLLLTRRLTRAADERERLLESAVRASDAERLRIARDLHDGVVQDLAGSSYALSTLGARADVAPSLSAALHEVSGSLRTSMRALRSLLVEIYPPDLHTAGLTAALTDLLAPVTAAGVRTRLRVTGENEIPPEATAMVWRVAQEAVRNTARHASAGVLEVLVAREGDDAVLVVTDDGVGFGPSTSRRTHRFGLRGLQSLVEEVGGSLRVRSAPGEGTSVRLQVPVR